MEPEIKGNVFEPVVMGTEDSGGNEAPPESDEAAFKLLALSVTTLWVVGEPPIKVAVAPTDPGGNVLATLMTFCPPGPGVATIYIGVPTDPVAWRVAPVVPEGSPEEKDVNLGRIRAPGTAGITFIPVRIAGFIGFPLLEDII